MNIGLISKEELIRELSYAINNSEFAAFIGAGMSKPAGYKLWKDMLKDPAESLKLDIDKEHDLLSVAQYYSNVNERVAIDQLIRENYYRKNLEPTCNHKLLADLPIDTYWTTNYDNLIERALEEANKSYYVKLRDADLRAMGSSDDVKVYKMHGDVSNPESAVITRSDYERYAYGDRKLFRNVLEGDLLSKTFLFLGMSFTDPNFNYVISNLSVLLGDAGNRTHYCIMKEEDDEYDRRKQELQILDLRRYNICTCLVNYYDEITKILDKLVKNYKRRRVFISGSIEDCTEFKESGGFIEKLSYELVKNDFKIVNGYGKGVGSYVINGVARFCYETNAKIGDYLTLMPFPISGRNQDRLVNMWKKYREEMISQCGIGIYISGNKVKDGVKINSDGVINEYKIAEEHELVNIPLKFTGWSAEKLYEDNKYKFNGDVKKFLERDYAGKNSVEELISLIKEIQRCDI